MIAAIKASIRRHEPIAIGVSIAASAALGEVLPSVVAFVRSVLA